MRVLYVLDSLAPGGTETSTVTLIPALREREVEPTIAIFRSAPDDLRKRAEADGARVELITETSLLARVRRLRRLIGDLQPDIVHTALYVADQIGRVAAARTGIPVVSSFVNTPYDDARTNDPNVRAWRLRMAQAVDATTARFLVSRFHAVSEGVRDANCRALRIPTSDVTVAERGRDTSRLGACSPDHRRRVRSTLGIEDEQPLVLNLGRLDHQKGQLVLVDAARLLADTLPRASVLVAGKDGSAARDLRARLDGDHVTAGRVRLLGHRDDVGDLLCAADVLVVSSHVEGTAGAAIEAMAMGVPIVATRVSGVAGVLAEDHNALMVPIGDPPALAAAIRRVLTDPGLAQRLTAQGELDFLERFTIEAAADRLTGLYRGMLETAR